MIKSKKVFLLVFLSSVFCVHGAEHWQLPLLESQSLNQSPKEAICCTSDAACLSSVNHIAGSTQTTINCCSSIECNCSGDTTENCCNHVLTNICGSITRVAGDLQKNVYEWAVEKYHQIVGRTAQARSEKSPKVQ